MFTVSQRRSTKRKPPQTRAPPSSSLAGLAGFLVAAVTSELPPREDSLNQLRAFQRCLKISESHWLTEIIIHSRGKTLFIVAPYGVSRHSNYVNRSFPRTTLGRS